MLTEELKDIQRIMSGLISGINVKQMPGDIITGTIVGTEGASCILNLNFDKYLILFIDMCDKIKPKER